MYNSNNTAATVSDGYGGSVSDGPTNNGGDNTRPEFQCDCVCSCCCQCYDIKPSMEIVPVPALNNNNAIDNTHKINSQDLVVHRLRRRRRKRRAKSGNFEQLLTSTENSTRASSLLINGSQLSRRNSAYCICKLQIKFVW